MLDILILRKIDKKLVKHITNLEKITQEDKELISDLNYDEIEFPMQEKDFSKFKVRNNMKIMKMDQFFRFTFQIKNLKTLWICCF